MIQLVCSSITQCQSYSSHGARATRSTDTQSVSLLPEKLAMVTPPVISTWRLPLTLPKCNCATVWALFLSISLSFIQATQGSFHGLSNDELVRVEKVTASGLPPGLATPSTIDMPIDHFNESDLRTYKNRYWINATYYREGGPVFL
jgi:hypothetical protein